MENDINMPSLRSDKEDDTDKEWTTEDTDEEWQQGNAIYNCRRLANKNWLILKSVNKLLMGCWEILFI